MTRLPLSIDLITPEKTAELAHWLAPQLRAGDCVLLSGEIGSGKTFFARNLIQSVLAHPEDVPSPTFTLVQIYDTAEGEIWHSDLYRLTSVDEVEELGLIEAFETSICLVEWPDKLGDLAPHDALSMHFAADPLHDTRRKLTLNWNDPKWDTRLDPLK
ncbi:tRNA (adenosine(37)-N6)-threonylcarbamoyltransferase complex ATPase subunit type 1 TsaE [Tropicibacter sp. R16_0]|uniref:tRNA (adenosine(37)-N6)-threonylcarbamoyltransferase complex ATPase subunit type 1 TsaE n=1 Tax=Tropicibacter sp. R16_0 TaxID=2821102 RepID=UPI001ADC3110|nr:tRNA (adenosine(37)-N6)-threonylcarbamoyltransferase complex ATPase subunit type 1 TsaE [Tropicibacter sp. R16_0]MBO9452445.1 tRNA (adenosine(37)-N6)-threonylcarbamoyltransferase complex ATPase subunit type 1 TsaE [Tropicibacter sp. R16_0]